MSIGQIQPKDSEPDNNSAECNSMAPRIVQFNGKRLCIRLEEIYWDVFEKMAKDQGCKFNEIVHAYYLDPVAEKNKTAFLRVKAIEWLSDQVNTFQHRVSLNNDEIHALLKTANQPAIVFSELQSVSACNQNFIEWLSKNLGLKAETIDTTAMRITFRRSYAVLLDKIEKSGGSINNEQVSILLPGFAMSVYVNLTLLSNFDEYGTTFLGFFK